MGCGDLVEKGLEAANLAVDGKKISGSGGDVMFELPTRYPGDNGHIGDTRV